MTEGKRQSQWAGFHDLQVSGLWTKPEHQSEAKGKSIRTRAGMGQAVHLLSLHHAVLNDHVRWAQLIQRSYSFRRCKEKILSHIIHFQLQCKHTFEEHRLPVVWHKVYCQKVAESSIQRGTCKPESLDENF